MPFKSKAQQRFMFAAEAKGKLKPGTARKWAHETKDIKGLPEHIKKAFMVGVVGELEKHASTPAWTRSEGKDPKGGLNRKGVASYRAANPGSKLQMAVTKDPSKLKEGSKDWKRRKSFCARMSGMPGAMKDDKGRPTRKALSLKKWNC